MLIGFTNLKARHSRRSRAGGERNGIDGFLEKQKRFGVLLRVQAQVVSINLSIMRNPLE